MEQDLTIRIVVPANILLLRPLDTFVRRFLEQLPLFSSAQQLISDLELVFNEAFMNVHDHAYPTDKKGLVDISIIVGEDRVELVFEDQGQGFDVEDVSPPDPDNPAERGRGVWLMRHCMDECTYNVGAEGRHVLRLVKRLPKVTSRL
jgi:serine/threonine-protein kinase RsbW